MSMFVDYEGDVNDLLKQADSAADPTELIAEAKDLIQQMKLEIRTMSGSEKTSSQATVQVGKFRQLGGMFLSACLAACLQCLPECNI